MKKQKRDLPSKSLLNHIRKTFAMQSNTITDNMDIIISIIPHCISIIKYYFHKIMHKNIKFFLCIYKNITYFHKNTIKGMKKPLLKTVDFVIIK